jgi:hypothetical protein
MTTARHDLQSFGIALADELPGTWTSTVTDHTTPEVQAAAARDVWDLNLMAEALARHHLGSSAVLTREDGTRLYIAGRPGRPRSVSVPSTTCAGFDSIR